MTMRPTPNLKALIDHIGRVALRAVGVNDGRSLVGVRYHGTEREGLARAILAEVLAEIACAQAPYSHRPMPVAVRATGRLEGDPNRPLSTPLIGAMLARHHTTVIGAMRRARRVENTPLVHAVRRRLIAEMGEHVVLGAIMEVRDAV